MIRGLVWVGLLASAALCYALYRWGGTFTIAGFLFNGGLAGFQCFKTYQVDRLPGRSFYRLEKPGSVHARHAARPALRPARRPSSALPLAREIFPARADDGRRRPRRPGLPFRFGWSYRSTPPCLSSTFTPSWRSAWFSCFCFFSCANVRARKQLAWLAGAAFLPATFFVWLITDHFHAGSVLQWNPGWVQNNGDFARPLAAFAQQPAQRPPRRCPGSVGTLKHFFQFWVINFGITLPLIIALLALLGSAGLEATRRAGPGENLAACFPGGARPGDRRVSQPVRLFLVRLFPVRHPGGHSAGRPGRADPASSLSCSNAIGGRRSPLPLPWPSSFQQSRSSFSPVSSRPRPGNGTTSS